MKKRFFAKHAKSSAALISLGIHAVLIVVALSFVAVTVITKEDQVFEAKPVNRPKMQLKKLQVPVNIKKKKTQKPKLRKRIVVQPKLNQSMPDIKMPEISGVKGGLGGGMAGGLGGAGGIGFSMPEIEIFGVKGRGEKIFLILDTGDYMLVDEMGGIAAYNIIKGELVRIVEELPPTALFNICVFSGGERTLFPKLVPATDANAQKVKAWLKPLNSVADAARSGNYGLKTLGPGGVDMRGDYRIGKFAGPIKKGAQEYGDFWSGSRRWYDAVMIAMQQQADTVFVLSNSWGNQRVALEKVPTLQEWKKSTSAGQRWIENLAKARRQLAEENKERARAGKPPKVVAFGEWGLIQEYFPGTERPPKPDFYYFKPRDFAEAFVLMKEKGRPKESGRISGLGKKKSGNIDFSLNVVQFIQKGASADERSAANFNQLTQICQGQYQTVAGLEEIKSYIK